VTVCVERLLPREQGRALSASRPLQGLVKEEEDIFGLKLSGRYFTGILVTR
jgi:hypothetical protein